ncbi:TIGR04283 family arsenosugar biosynthesis glycosyltransferase [Formosa haliotis]|uniref:TIGR04283 family arsenosugar biosynthesis glycosyltransferase n=1 Tax=Formosa haliotis TaxID=1555194 RepID=UPI0008257805|nr:TIGR04283 family arsenosugar biosynthesis glycosyltransferase [Formosa haliotis]
MSNISIIIPVINEAKNIQKLIPYLLNNTNPKDICSIIIVDGGSTDGTQKVVKSFKNVQLVISEKGRAKQMNLGAKHAKGTILYFLHADSYPPKHFDKEILNAVKDHYESGCFKMAFTSQHWWLKLAGWFTQFNWKISRGGDQSLFVSQSLFHSLGGFDESYKIYEDNHFIQKLYKTSNFKVIQKTLTTSARRYETMGIWKLQYHFWMIHLKYRLGASPETLYSYYLKHITVKN